MKTVRRSHAPPLSPEVAILTNPDRETLRRLLPTSADPASPQRLAVYPRRDEGSVRVVLGVGKNVGDFFWGFLEKFVVLGLGRVTMWAC